MATHRDLLTWQKAMDLVVEIYKLIDLLPREETYCLADQMRRAAVSIPSNIAEGHGRNSINDFKRFLAIAQGSRAELETQLDICLRVHYLTEDQVKKAMSLSVEVRKMIYSMQYNMR